MLAAAILSGSLIGAALGLLGAGGSTFTVPIFVYLLSFPAKEAIAMSLAVVGATSAASAALHWRAGNVNVRVAAIFAAVAALGTLAGAHLARFLTGGTQLVIFGGVMLAAAVFMLRGGAPGARPLVPGPVAVAAFGPILPAALAVGLLTGVAGVGGGFLIVPALLLLRLSMGQAVGTSLLIIAANCTIGVYGYMGQVHIAWTPVLLVTAGTAPGVALGTYLHRYVPQGSLRRGFGVLLVLMAAFILYQNLARGG